MQIEIRSMEKKDVRKAIQFAIQGMHFDWYLDSKFLLNAYGRYFWYLETNRATQMLAAYVNNEFAGVLLAEMYGEKRQHGSLGERLYIRCVDLIQRLFFQGGAGLYEKTTAEMLEVYRNSHQPDGEIIFLAADPAAKIKGVGTALLRELERREAGKTVFLHTDNACTYQFYEHRDFECVVEKDIVLDMGKRMVPLTCYIFSKCINK